MTEQTGYTPRGMYFEEFEVGYEMVSAARTITETDIVSFAALTGDWTQIHVNAEYAKGTIFGQRVAHGLLGLSYAVGLGAQLGFIESEAEELHTHGSISVAEWTRRQAGVTLWRLSGGGAAEVTDRFLQSVIVNSAAGPARAQLVAAPR